MYVFVCVEPIQTQNMVFFPEGKKKRKTSNDLLHFDIIYHSISHLVYNNVLVRYVRIRCFVCYCILLMILVVCILIILKGVCMTTGLGWVSVGVVKNFVCLGLSNMFLLPCRNESIA